MAATAWTVQQSSRTTGTQPTNQAIDSANGNSFVNDGKTRLRLNGAASATGQVTIVQGGQKCNLGSQHNIQTAVNALDTTGEFLEFGPFPPEFWNDANGLVQVTYIGTVTGITAQVIKDA